MLGAGDREAAQRAQRMALVGVQDAVEQPEGERHACEARGGAAGPRHRPPNSSGISTPSGRTGRWALTSAIATTVWRAQQAKS